MLLVIASTTREVESLLTSLRIGHLVDPDIWRLFDLTETRFKIFYLYDYVRYLLTSKTPSEKKKNFRTIIFHLGFFPRR
jgi:hypothetical protein